MLAFLSIVPILLVIGWLVAEARCQRKTRVIAGFAALIFIAIVEFLWGGFAAGLKQMQFPEPHDSAADRAIMDAADRITTNKINE